MQTDKKLKQQKKVKEIILPHLSTVVWLIYRSAGDMWHKVKSTVVSFSVLRLKSNQATTKNVLWLLLTRVGANGKTCHLHQPDWNMHKALPYFYSMNTHTLSAPLIKYISCRLAGWPLRINCAHMHAPTHTHTCIYIIFFFFLRQYLPVIRSQGAKVNVGTTHATFTGLRNIKWKVNFTRNKTN